MEELVAEYHTRRLCVRCSICTTGCGSLILLVVYSDVIVLTRRWDDRDPMKSCERLGMLGPYPFFMLLLSDVKWFALFLFSVPTLWNAFLVHAFRLDASVLRPSTAEFCENAAS